MRGFIELTLSSNDKPTIIRVDSIVQMFEDTTSDGKECTRIEFEGDYTRVKEDISTIMRLIGEARLNSLDK